MFKCIKYSQITTYVMSFAIPDVINLHSGWDKEKLFGIFKFKEQRTVY